jgi:hypothetical protein
MRRTRMRKDFLAAVSAVWMLVAVGWMYAAPDNPWGAAAFVVAMVCLVGHEVVRQLRR